MTTEDDFQRLLDLNPDDHTTRLVFADWLEERGDMRGPGYRALGMLRLRPFWGEERASWYNAAVRDGQNDPASDLPGDWFNAFPSKLNLGEWMWFRSRRQAGDAAARAFVNLPFERRQQLLKGTS